MPNLSQLILSTAGDNTRFSLGHMAWLGLLLSFIYLSPAQGQQAFIVPIQQVAGQHKPPTYAEISQRIALDTSQLETIELGAKLILQISETRQLQLQVVMLSTYINGDKVFRAEGRDDDLSISLILTLGQRSLFGNLSSGDASYQIYAIANSDSALYQGWLYKPGNLIGIERDFQNDYIVIEQASGDTAIEKPKPEIISILPLQAAAVEVPAIKSVPGQEKVAINTVGINSSNFRISQDFSRNSVLVGNSVDVNLEFENISSQTHNDLYVEIFFVLDNSKLLTAPSECRTQFSLSLQEVIYCELGDFLPGERKTFSYSVATDQNSKPRVISSVIMGSLRLDGFVNVVEDIRTDSDADGISDFNEMLLATDAADPLSVNRSNSVIDVLALYTPGSAALYPNGVQTRINQLISVANQIYVDSGVSITLRPVYHGMVDYNDSDDMDTALNHLIEKTDGAFANVDQLRQTYGADLVMLFRPSQASEGRCGLAPVGGFNTDGDFSSETEREYAYSHIAVDCPVDMVVAHELGHNMGLSHSHLEDGAGGTFNFSTGYGVEGQFVTVMAYPGAFNTDTRVPQFSNPLVDCLGFACGLAADGEFGADAVLSLNLVRHQIANYYPTKVADLPITSIATLSGEASNAIISIAASSDGGLTFSNSVGISDSVNLEAEVEIDARHLGQNGGIYVLIGLEGQGLFQLNEAGELEQWDNTVEGLIAFSGLRALRNLEHLTIMDGFRFGSAFSNKQLAVFIAYWVESTGELVYTRKPFLLNIN